MSTWQPEKAITRRWRSASRRHRSSHPLLESRSCLPTPPPHLEVDLLAVERRDAVDACCAVDRVAAVVERLVGDDAHRVALRHRPGFVRCWSATLRLSQSRGAASLLPSLAGSSRVKGAMSRPRFACCTRGALALPLQVAARESRARDWQRGGRHIPPRMHAVLWEAMRSQRPLMPPCPGLAVTRKALGATWRWWSCGGVKKRLRSQPSQSNGRY